MPYLFFLLTTKDFAAKLCLEGLTVNKANLQTVTTHLHAGLLANPGFADKLGDPDFSARVAKQAALSANLQKEALEMDTAELRAALGGQEQPTVERANSDLIDYVEEIFKKNVSLAEVKRRIHDQVIKMALETTSGNITRAAKILDMKRPRLAQIINASEELKTLCQGGGR